MNQYYFETLALHPPPEPFESFTSYITRLAQDNGLKTMQDFAYVFFPETVYRHDHSGLAKYFTDYTPPAFGSVAKVGVCRETQLQAMTFFHLAAKFDRDPWYDPLWYFLRGVISPYLRYCPKCLIEASKPFYSLQWRFLLISQCHKHNCPLLDRCGHCGQRIPIFSLPPKIASCPTCGGDLKDCLSTSNFSLETPKASIDTDDLVFLLMPNKGEEVKTSVTSIGALLASMRRSRRLSAPQLSKTLRIKLKEVVAIEQTTSGTTLLNYVIYASYMGVSLRYLLTTACSQDIPQWQSPEEEYVRLVKKAMPRLEELSKPVRLSTVSQLIGVPAPTLNHYPRVKTLLTQYNETYYAEKSRQFALREEELVKRVREARDQLLALGRAITQRNVCQIVGRWSTSLKKYPRVKELLDQYSSEYRLYLLEAKEQREKDLIEKVKKAIQQLEDLQKPITFKSVNQIVGVSLGILRYHARARELIAKHAPENLKARARERMLIEEALAQKVEKTIQELKASGACISLQKICEQIGETLGKLRSYPRVYKILKPYVIEEFEMQRVEREGFLLAQVQEIVTMVKPFSKTTFAKVVKEQIGLAYVTLRKYPQVRAFIDQYAEDCQNQQTLQNIESLLNQLQGAYTSLKKDRLLTIELLAEESGIKSGIIRSYPVLRAFAEQCIEESVQRQIGQQDAEFLERVHNAIQTLKSLNRRISQAAIIKALHISKKRLKACPQAQEILEQALKEYWFQKEVNILEQIKEAIVSLHNSDSPITQSAISRSLGTYRNHLCFYPRVREIMVRVKEYGQELKEKQNSRIKAQSQRIAGREHRLHQEHADSLAQELLAMIEEAIEQMYEQGSQR